VVLRDIRSSGNQDAGYQKIRRNYSVFNYYLLWKTKIDNVTPAKAGVQGEKAGFPLPRE
jgi:hypothetical protein